MIKLKIIVAFLAASSLSASLLFAVYQMFLGTMTAGENIAFFVALVPAYLLYSLLATIPFLVFNQTAKQALGIGMASGFAMFVIFLLVTSPDKAIGQLALTTLLVGISFGVTLFILLVLKIVASPNKAMQSKKCSAFLD